MANPTNVSATVIFDNGGGITVQLINSNPGTADWAHYYNGEPEQALGDVRDALVEGDFSGFDGDEPDAHDCVPTHEQIRNGGYRVEKFDSLDELNGFMVDSDDCGNMVDFAKANAKRMAENTR